LFIAGGEYVGFAVGEGVSPIWALSEVLQVVVFGAVGLLGLRGSPYWLAAGWALHPLWDVVVHYTLDGPLPGTGASEPRSPVTGHGSADVRGQCEPHST
jgi:hypothetical protein